MKSLSSHQRGLLMTVVGVIVLSPDALLLRLIDADHWTLMFWRSLFAAVSFFALNAVLERRSPMKTLRDLFKNGWSCALFFAGSNTCFIFSVTHTAAANTLVILAAMPFIAAILTVVLIRQNLPFRTWATILVAMLGIVVVFWGRFGDGNMLGDVAALLCALFMAAMLVTLNIKPNINSFAAIGLGSLFSALIALCMGASPDIATSGDFFYLVLNGGIVIPIAMGLITYGPKYISAPEVSLIMLLETILGPIWVWLVLKEQPPLQTFAGGSLVIVAILANAWLGFRAERPTVVVEEIR